MENEPRTFASTRLRNRPVLGPSVSRGGSTIVQSRPLARTISSIARMSAKACRST